MKKKNENLSQNDNNFKKNHEQVFNSDLKDESFNDNFERIFTNHIDMDFDEE